MRLTWQLLVGLLVTIGLASTIGGTIDTSDTGTFGMVATASNVHPATIVVASVQSNSAAANADIHVGDELQFAPTAANRIVAFTPVPGDLLHVRDAGRAIDLVATVDRTVPNAALVVVVVLARLAFLLIAAMVAWRRVDDPAARALALFLACFGVGLSYDFGLLPAVWARLASLLLVQNAFMVGGLAVLAFAVQFPTLPERGLRLLLRRAIVPLGIAGMLLSNSSILLSYFGGALAPRTHQLITIPYLVWYIAIIVASFVAFIDAYRASKAADRVRIRWVIGTFAIGFSGLIILFVGVAAGLSGASTQALQYVALTILAVPFGLGYVIMRHRMLDIGFVINRAVVYTGVSVIIVGAFILFEWLVAHVVEVNGNTSALLQLGAALALGLSARFIHARVDRYVDDFFFRERHLAEAAIRRFAHEAMLITDPTDLTTKTVAVTQEKARLAGVAFYARKNDRYVALESTFEASPDISENDFAALDMRTHHQRVELLDRHSDIPGEIAFPMIVRGKLAGFLACGPKTTHEALAPDESDAIALLARDSGIALDSLRLRTIERELGFLSYDSNVPQAVRTRLAGLVAPE